MNKEIFAAFVLATDWKETSLFASTTRLDGTVGLPGGKVEKGESPFAAAFREAQEEGWLLSPIGKNPVQIREVDGKLVAWFPGIVVCALENYKEKERGIRPVLLTSEEIVASGMGNEFLF